MNRRDFLTASVAAASALASRSAFATPVTNDHQGFGVVVREGRPLHTISPDFMGLGYEISSVARPGLMSRANNAYVQLVRTLSVHGVIRVGGNTADYASYAPAAPAVSSPYGTVVNDAVLKELGGFLEATGWKLIWAIEPRQRLRDGRDRRGEGGAGHRRADDYWPSRSATSLICFPTQKHRKPDYGYEQWLADYRRYKTALRAQLPGIPFAGPDVAGKTEWVTRFAADEGKDVVLLTHHYYREGQNPGSTIEKLLGVDPKLQPQLDQLRAASQSCGLPYRICEVNSFSGGGRPGVSDTMAGGAMGARLYVHARVERLLRRQYGNRCESARLYQFLLAHRRR